MSCKHDINTPCIKQCFDDYYYDSVNHPQHYIDTDAKCSACNGKIECIDIVRHLGFSIGNAIKYIWRHRQKNGIEDLRKAIWYLNDEIKRQENNQHPGPENDC